MTRDCDRCQEQVVGGELSPEARIHLAECDECGLFLEIPDLLRATLLSRGAAPAPDLAVVDRALASAEPLHGYRLISILGRGGQGIVCRARDRDTPVDVALKIARGKTRELLAGRLIQHPNVCPVFHAETHGALGFVVMKLIDGPTLATRIESLDERAALRIFAGICAGVAAAHDQGVLHLDLKPQNILLRGDEPVVTDFGLAGATGDIGVGGTPAYMSPEQRRGDVVDVRSDVFALGRMLAELTGGGRWRGVIARATAEDPAARFPHVRALADAVAAVTRRRRRWIRAAVVAGLSAGLAGAVVAAVRRDVPRPTEVNLARNRNPGTASTPRAPHPWESDPGWGGGTRADEIVDGETYCVKNDLHPEGWECGLALRGGAGNHGGERCGVRQATIVLDGSKTVHGVRVTYHGQIYAPSSYRIDVHTTSWTPVQTVVDAKYTKCERRPSLSRREQIFCRVEDRFAPVHADKVRLVVDDCPERNASLDPGQEIRHVWIDELEVLGR